MKSQEYKQYPKVLVGMPTYEGKHYIFPQAYAAVKNFTYPNYDFVVVDNSKGSNYYHKLRRLGFKGIHRVPRGNNSRQALVNAQNFIFQKAIAEDYDFVVFVESDLLPHPSAIQDLINKDKPVYGFTYWLGTGEVKLPCIFFTAHRKDLGLGGTRLIGVNFREDGSKYLDMQEVEQFLGTGDRLVHGVGFGTTAIRRDVFTRFPLWHDERFTDKHSDVYFYMDLSTKGIPVFVNTDVVIPHYPSPWDLVTDR